MTGEVVVTGTRTAKVYNVTFAGNAAEDVVGAANKATYNEDYQFTIPAAKGWAYKLESIVIGGKSYSGYSVADFVAIGAKFGIDQVTARIIRNRGVIGDDAVNEFLNGKISDIADPALLKDGQRLVDILAQKIADRAKIRIIGDYDIDGVMSTYILVKALKRAGACVDYMIPDRVKDGYGLNVHLIDKAYEDGIDTVVTCDNGIAAIEEIAHAKELGMTVLVTDHHAVPFEDIKGIKIYKESKADAVVNPHQI